MRSVVKRFDGTFVFILIIENINFGLFQMVQLCAQDLFKAYMD
jgi:MFS-type transporter involved in bile tolerance (Atg22 family)